MYLCLFIYLSVSLSLSIFLLIRFLGFFHLILYFYFFMFFFFPNFIVAMKSIYTNSEPNDLSQHKLTGESTYLNDMYNT